MPRSSTVAPSIDAPFASAISTRTFAAGRKCSTIGSLFAVSFAVTGPPTPCLARAISVYGRPTSSSNAKPPSASVVAVRGGFELSTTVAPPTGSSWTSTTWPSSRSSPRTSSSVTTDPAGALRSPFVRVGSRCELVAGAGAVATACLRECSHHHTAPPTSSTTSTTSARDRIAASLARRPEVEVVAGVFVFVVLVFVGFVGFVVVDVIDVEHLRELDVHPLHDLVDLRIGRAFRDRELEIPFDVFVGPLRALLFEDGVDH